MNNRIENFIKEHGNIWIGISLSLILFPWLIRIISVCGDNGAASKYGECAFGHGPLVGASLVIGVAASLIYCKLNRIKAPLIHAVLHIIGIVGLLGLSDIPFIAGSLYALSLIAIASYKSHGSKELVTSPVYTIGIFSIFLALSLGLDKLLPYREKLANPVYLALRSVVSGSGDGVALIVAFSVSVFGLIWLNIWTKRHSVLIYIIGALGLIFVAYFTIGYLAARGFATHGF